MYHTIRAFVKICTYARMSRTIKASNSSAYTFHGLLTNDPVSKNYSIISWSIRSFIFFYFRYSRISTTHHYRQWINFKFNQWSQCAHDPNRNNNKKNMNHSLIDYVIIIYSWIERWVIYRPEILYSIILYALLFTCLYVYGWYYRKLARRKKNSFVLHNNIILIKKKFLSVFLLIKKSICIYFTLCTWCTTDLTESESALVGIKQYTVCNWCNFSESK